VLPNRFRISRRATETLKQIKGRTGLTPNILCRIALVLSLQDGAKGGKTDVDLDGSEFNTPTLFGDYRLVYESVIRQVHGPLKPKDVQRVVGTILMRALIVLNECAALETF
jgi:DNA sulfur modification protein DndE